MLKGRKKHEKKTNSTIHSLIAFKEMK